MIGGIRSEYHVVGGRFGKRPREKFGENYYGRTSKPDDFLLVLREHRGTCSSKHSLLIASAEELGLPLRLTLEIYRMTDANTPGVGSILIKCRMEFISEAHCRPTCQKEHLDFTKELKPGQEPIIQFFI